MRSDHWARQHWCSSTQSARRPRFGPSGNAAGSSHNKGPASNHGHDCRAGQQTTIGYERSGSKSGTEITSSNMVADHETCATWSVLASELHDRLHQSSPCHPANLPPTNPGFHSRSTSSLPARHGTWIAISSPRPGTQQVMKPDDGSQQPQWPDLPHSVVIGGDEPPSQRGIATP